MKTTTKRVPKTLTAVRAAFRTRVIAILERFGAVRNTEQNPWHEFHLATPFGKLGINIHTEYGACIMCQFAAPDL